MADKMSFLEAVQNRRSIYPLSADIPISDARVKELVVEAIKHVPSSFNSQSTRLVVLLNAEHQKFWDFVKEVLKPQVPEDQFPKTEQRLNMFKAAHGTVSWVVLRRTRQGTHKCLSCLFLAYLWEESEC